MHVDEEDCGCRECCVERLIYLVEDIVAMAIIEMAEDSDDVLEIFSEFGRRLSSNITRRLEGHDGSDLN